MARAIATILLMAIVLVAAMQAVSSVDITDTDLASEKSLWALYDRWCEHHSVARGLGEKARRFSVFKENARMVHKFNQGGAPYKLSLNLFGDMTDEEVDNGYGRCSNPLPNSAKQSQDRVTHGVLAARDNYPTYVDWRMTGYDQRPSAVTNVKMQRGCGACWAFAATAAEAGVIDCDKESGGCKGGNPVSAFKYMIDHGGISTEADYPYFADEHGYCLVPKRKDPIVTIDGFKEVPPKDEVALLQAVAAQPVVVGIDTKTFRRYGGGVFVGPCGTNQTHSMTVVGYGTTDETDPIDYWIIKNSWGPKWGEDGYIRMARGVNGGTEGLCGILMGGASYPVKK
ncbi:hypothetical protein VPH35_102664 [Triticum aestivum]